MKVIIDGVEVHVQNDVRIIHDDIIYGMDENEEDITGHLQIVLNHEGIIADIFDSDGEATGFTTGMMYEDIAELCLD